MRDGKRAANTVTLGLWKASSQTGGLSDGLQIASNFDNSAQQLRGFLIVQQKRPGIMWTDVNKCVQKRKRSPKEYLFNMTPSIAKA